MLRNKLWLIVLVIGWHSCQALNSLTYQLEHRGKDQLYIKLEFKPNRQKMIKIYLPNNYAGNTELYKSILIDKISGAKLINSNIPHIKFLEILTDHVTLEYTLKQSFSSEPQNIVQARAPIVNSKYVHFIAASGLIIPEFTTANVTLSWSLPITWNLATSYAAGRLKHSAMVTMDSLGSALFVAGDFRIVKLKIKGKPVYIATRGQWPFTDRAMQTRVGSIIELERDFWDDHDYPYFIASFLPLKLENKVLTGLGLTNAFAAFLSTEQPLDQRALKLIIHEYFHIWNNPRIFTKDFSKQTEYYWFTEGITEYYTDLLAFRGKFIKLQEYITSYNNILFNYNTNEAKHTSNKNLIDKFWQNHDINKLPYQRGYLLAHKWNTEIKQTNSKISLDNIVKDFVKLHRKQDKPLTVLHLQEIADQYLDIDIKGDVEKYIIAGEKIPMYPNTMGDCVRIKYATYNLVDPGFDHKTSLATGFITGMQKSSKAYSVGLRDGQQLVRLDFNQLHSSKPISVKVNQNNQQIDFKYYSSNLQPVEIPQLNLDLTKALNDPGACMSWFYQQGA